ncbi:MAG: hypothetical protein APF76_10285 [Desulfitibacter sp. BRH_c19]|nr:MAG: hypothetical protein APF76_10285 [Desulfitibacter sp. BRH_c19]
MFGILPIGPWEMGLILVIVLIVFGAGKLPQVGKSVGKAISEFRGSVKDVEDAVKIEDNDKEEK